MKVDLNKQLNKIISHTELPIAFAGYEDKFIRYFDLRSGECIYSMIAHQDSISTLTVDPSGSYLLSGGFLSFFFLFFVFHDSIIC